MKFNISLLFLIIFAVMALASPIDNNNLAKRSTSFIIIFTITINIIIFDIIVFEKILTIGFHLILNYK